MKHYESYQATVVLTIQTKTNTFSVEPREPEIFQENNYLSVEIAMHVFPRTIVSVTLLRRPDDTIVSPCCFTWSDNLSHLSSFKAKILSDCITLLDTRGGWFSVSLNLVSGSFFSSVVITIGHCVQPPTDAR